MLTDIDMRYTSMAVDDAGFVHLAAATGEGSDYRGVWYLTNRNGSWSATQVGSIPDGYDDGYLLEPSLALDRDGSAWIAYTQSPCPPLDCTSDGIFYVTNVTGQWSDPARLAGPGFVLPTLAVSDGVIHVAYVDACRAPSPPDCHFPVYYGNTRGGSWGSERVFEESGSGSVALDLDGSGSARILAEAFGYPPERISAAFEGSGFTNEPVWRSDRVAQAWPLLLEDDPSGSIMAAWDCACEGVGASLYVARRSGDSWGKATVVLRGPGVASAALAKDGTLAVVGATGDAYIYADNAAGSFQIRTLAALSASEWAAEQSGWPGTMALALDRAGRPHIVYIDYGEEPDTSLWYVSGPALAN